MSKKTKVDRLHDQMPAVFKTKTNPNWKSIIDALGDNDQLLVDLMEEIKNQFFVKTASKPYIDRLGGNVKVSRPKLLGMDDQTFRKYIPILAYQPKQVKLIMDQLLDVFFFKESTTAFTETINEEFFYLKDGWKLEYEIDSSNTEQITFTTDDFVDISNATAQEVTSVINRKAQFSFAVVFEDRIRKKNFVRVFSNTVGSKGSVQIIGGLSLISLQFKGYNENSGNGSNTTWNITKIGDTTTLTATGGVSPNLSGVAVGDIALIDLPGNEGSFAIESIDLSDNSFSVSNLFSTPGTFDHSLLPDTSVKFMSSERMVVYTVENRAVVWEVSPGEIIVEMPASPPVVKRNLKGSFHINGVVGKTTSMTSNTLDLDDASDWPLNGGKFVLTPLGEIKSHILTSTEDTFTSTTQQNRFDIQKKYSYTSKVGNVLSGITPDLPEIADIYEYNLIDAVRSNNIVTFQTATPHTMIVGEGFASQNTTSQLSTLGLRVDVLLSDTASDVALKTANIITSLSGFTAGTVSNVITITTTTNINTTNAIDIDTTFGINTVQEGSISQPEITDITTTLAGAGLDVVGDGLRLEITDNTTTYHVWYNVVDGINEQTNAGLSELPNGFSVVKDIIDSTHFTAQMSGEAGTAIDGLVRAERNKTAIAGSFATLTTSQLDTGILGAHIWDLDASFVLSSLTSNINADIKAGSIVRSIDIDIPNNIPDEEGFVIFSFGTEAQEGPVRMFGKPNDSTIQLDPAYIFQNNHNSGSPITVIRRRGAQIMSGAGSERAGYIVDPGQARGILQELMKQSKSTGVFLNFLIRFPKQLYSTLDVYRSCEGGLWPITEQDKLDCEDA